MNTVDREVETKVGDCDYCNQRNILVKLEFDSDYENYLEKCYYGCSDENASQDEEPSVEVGDCDHCYIENVYIRFQYDGWDEHIMNQCYYGCGDERNILNEATQKINVISLNMLSQIPCYSSTWELELKVDGHNHFLRLIRLNGEKRIELLEKIINCKNINEIKRLSMKINMN